MIDELPDAPDPATDAPPVFNAKAAAFVLAQKQMVPQVNGALGAMSAWAAGGAYAFQYAFDSSTTNADPGPGKFRLSSGTQSASTALRIDNVLASGQDLTAVWTDLLAVTSAVKGSLRLVSATDPTKWMILDVTGSAAATGYRNLTVSARAFSATNPFSNNDAVMVYLQRGGDKGDQAAPVNPELPVLIVREERAAGTNGGTFAVGENTRLLNTVSKNTINGASLSNSAITLPAGTYRITGSAPAKGASTASTPHKIYLTNSAYAVVLLGTSELAPAGSVTRSEIDAHLTLAASATLTLKHVNAGGIPVDYTGMGHPSNAFSTVEVYAQLTIEKVA